MESKINYHALSMDEIVFDNRNKNYGAFILRQTSERNQLKALIMMAGISIAAFCLPILLKSLGFMAEKIIEKEILISCPMAAPIIEIKKANTLATPQKTVPKKMLDNANRQMEVSKDTAEIKNSIEKKPNINEQVIGSTSGVTTITSIVPGTVGPSFGSGTTKPNSGTYEGTTFTSEIPSFIGGQDAFDQFVEEHIIYPQRAIEDDVEGTCEIRFVVNVDGSLEQFSISNSSRNKELDVAALALVKKLPKYNPGRQNGQAVRVWCVIPITFTLK